MSLLSCPVLAGHPAISKSLDSSLRWNDVFPGWQLNAIALSLRSNTIPQRFKIARACGLAPSLNQPDQESDKDIDT
jgi:hypothetical protein